MHVSQVSTDSPVLRGQSQEAWGGGGAGGGNRVGGRGSVGGWREVNVGLGHSGIL